MEGTVGYRKGRQKALRREAAGGVRGAFEVEEQAWRRHPQLWKHGSLWSESRMWGLWLLRWSPSGWR